MNQSFYVLLEVWNYHWSPELLSAAQEKGRIAFKNNLKRGRKYPEQDILIINSNTNQKSSVCIQLLQTARKNGFKTEVYLISKFFGRSTEGNIGRKLDKRHVDEEFYPLVDHIQVNRESFDAMGEQEKIAFIQAFLREQL